jgi:hypothetical protein
VESIEKVIYIESPLDTDRCLFETKMFLQGFDTFESLFDPLRHNYFLKVGAEVVAKRPALAFRLSILKACLPSEFERSLFCFWWAIFDSELLQRDDEAFSDLILVCLSHDVGLLDVNPEFAKDDHDPRANVKAQDGYFDHTQFGARFLERSEENLSEAAKNGVLQHHESIDGTGYPNGLSGIFLNEYGQMVHMFDTLYSIFQKFYKPIGKSLSDLQPLIEINAVTHFGACASRVLELLARMPPSSSVFFKPKDYGNIVQRVETMSSYVEQSIGVIQEFTENVGFRHDSKQLFILQNSFIHIALSYHKMNDQLKKAIAHEKAIGDETHKVSSKPLEQNFLSLREIIFHINELHRRLQSYLVDVPAESQVFAFCSQTIHQLDEFNKQYKKTGLLTNI